MSSSSINDELSSLLREAGDDMIIAYRQAYIPPHMVSRFPRLYTISDARNWVDFDEFCRFINTQYQSSSPITARPLRKRPRSDSIDSIESCGENRRSFDMAGSHTNSHFDPIEVSEYAPSSPIRVSKTFDTRQTRETRNFTPAPSPATPNHPDSPRKKPSKNKCSSVTKAKKLAAGLVQITRQVWDDELIMVKELPENWDIPRDRKVAYLVDLQDDTTWGGALVPNHHDQALPSHVQSGEQSFRRRPVLAGPPTLCTPANPGVPNPVELNQVLHSSHVRIHTDIPGWAIDTVKQYGVAHIPTVNELYTSRTSISPATIMPTPSAVPTGPFEFGSTASPVVSTPVKLGKTRPANSPLQQEDQSKKARSDHGSDSDMDPSTPTPSPRKSGRSASLGGLRDLTKPSTIGGVLSGQMTSKQPQRDDAGGPRFPFSGQSLWPPISPLTQTPATGDQTPRPAINDTIRALFLREPEGGWPTVHGMTQARLTKAIRTTSIVDWRTYEGQKVLAVPERGRVDFQIAALVTLVEDIVRQAFPDNKTLDVFPGGPTDERLQPHHPFPAIITGLSNKEAEALLSEFCLANAHRAVFFYPFDKALPVSTFAVSLENIAIRPGPDNDARAAAEIVRFLKTAREVADHVNMWNDNIPFTDQPSPVDLYQWVLNTVTVKGAFIQRKGSPFPIHHLYIHPPSTDPLAHKKWIDLLSGLVYYTRKGDGRAIKPLLCEVCKGIDHAVADCLYTQIPGWPTLPIGGSNNRGRGSGRGRGGPVGRFNRGRGAYTSTGWA
ncbi:hypothetical protein M422DRAFT_260323 [Sphaerobolus stellatus SS14]|uniref:Uncharacterized protein n=1 Tax=Sphaerobolus stellatus (strain SS14) TaxID=990650 RepID=A0A0C9U2T0_SPHS4|nr:hypothetical protein M422DRAFT_260323 [Sphaerobolus stellatus SS14]